MPPQTTWPPLSTAASAAGTNAPTGANIIAASNRSGGSVSELPAQTAPKDFANRWAFKSPLRVKAKNLPALIFRHLCNNMRRRAEAEYSEAFGVSSFCERPEPNQTGAKQGSGIDVRVTSLHGETESFIRHSKLRVTAIARITSKTRAVA